MYLVVRHLEAGDIVLEELVAGGADSGVADVKPDGHVPAQVNVLARVSLYGFQGFQKFSWQTV